MNIRSIYALLEQLAVSKNSPLVLIGHSYGGDYVMQAILSMSTRVKISYLITLDAISPIYCTPTILSNLITKRLGEITGNIPNNGSGAGCQQIPQEINPVQYNLIRSRVQWWHNYHQQDLFSVLRSGPISTACNQPIRHTEFKDLINGHIAMGKSNVVWNDIKALVSSIPPFQCTPKHL